MINIDDKILKTQFNKLKDINQKLKLESDLYYIDRNKMIYLNSLVPFIEKVAILNDDIDIESYDDGLVLPNAFYEFYSKAKKTTMKISKETGQVIFDDKEKSDSYYVLHKVEPEKVPFKNFYTRLDIILHFIDSTEDGFIDLDEEDNESIINSQPYFMDIYEGNTMVVTKNVFLSIKKGDQVSYKKLGKIIKGKDSYYVLFRHRTSLMDIYILTASI